MSRTGELMRQADELLGPTGRHRSLMNLYYKGDDEDAFPRFLERAQGYEVVDSSGKTWIDWVNAGGPVVLGYRHPAVEDAIRSQLEAGPTLTTLHPIELEVASMLVEMIPCAEVVAFGKNGSDALTGAVRIARTATGRDLILQHGFHGFQDWYACKEPGVTGIPDALSSLVIPFPYNNLAVLERLFEEHSGQVAAVVMEPIRGEMPAPGYLEGVRELTSKHGALLVFDEVVTCFRLANGGAQELFGVTPDLATCGKAVANGMPLSALVGKREYMKHLSTVFFGMTFRDETLSLAAARAVLTTLREQPVAEHLADVGTRVRDAFLAKCAEHGIPGNLIGPPARMVFSFCEDATLSADGVLSRFLMACWSGGILTNGSILPSLAHDDEAIERTASALDAALWSLQPVSQNARRTVKEAVRGGFANANGGQSESPLPDGFIDGLREENGSLRVWGWLLLEDGPADAIEFVTSTGGSAVAEVEERPGIGNAHPDTPAAARAGFIGMLPAEKFARNGGYEFTMRARRGDEVVFACPIHRGKRIDPWTDVPKFEEGTLSV